MPTSFTINPEKVAKALLAVIATLLVFHIMYVFTQLVYGYKLRHIFKVFDFNNEANLPTLYSVAAIIFSSILLFFVGFFKKHRKEKFAFHWIFLGVIFFFMAFDEAAKMHEQLNAIIREYLPESSMDFLFFAWVIPYAILAVVIGFSFIKFLLNLPRRTAKLFIASGAIFITGAIGLEMITSYFRYDAGLAIHLAITIEETLEMLGIVLFIYTILDYIKNNIGAVAHLNFSWGPSLESSSEKVRPGSNSNFGAEYGRHTIKERAYQEMMVKKGL